MLKIFNKIVVSVCILASFLVPAVNVSAHAQEDFKSKSENTSHKPIDKAYLKNLEDEADKYFYAGLESDSISTREVYLSRALAKFMLLLKLQPDNPIYCTQIGVIHDVCHHCPQAKEYFFRAINLDSLNPFANFYFAEYYLFKKDYNNALKHYLVAYNNGYKNYYQVNLKIATVYERLGDIEQAKRFYTLSNLLNSNQAGLQEKVVSLDKVYYSKEDYKKRTIRE